MTSISRQRGTPRHEKYACGKKEIDQSLHFPFGDRDGSFLYHLWPILCLFEGEYPIVGLEILRDPLYGVGHFYDLLKNPLSSSVHVVLCRGGRDIPGGIPSENRGILSLLLGFRSYDFFAISIELRFFEKNSCDYIYNVWPAGIFTLI
jgi:hypothetical protein